MPTEDLMSFISPSRTSKLTRLCYLWHSLAPLSENNCIYIIFPENSLFKEVFLFCGLVWLLKHMQTIKHACWNDGLSDSFKLHLPALHQKYPRWKKEDKSHHVGFCFLFFVCFFCLWFSFLMQSFFFFYMVALLLLKYESHNSLSLTTL